MKQTSGCGKEVKRHVECIVKRIMKQIVKCSTKHVRNKMKNDLGSTCHTRCRRRIITMDRQIHSLTHPDPHCLHEWRRKEGFGRRRREAWFGFLKRRTASTSAPPLYIFSVHGSDNNNFFHINAIITTPERNKPIKTQPLVDSGTGGTFMDQNYTRKHGFNLTKLEYLIMAQNMDRTKNKQGTIWYYTDLDLQVNGKTNTEQFLITGLGNQKIILGLPWLWKHNLKINWKEGTLQWRTTAMKEVLDKEEHLNCPTNTSDKVLLEYLGMENKLWINSKENLATKQASEAGFWSKSKETGFKPRTISTTEISWLLGHLRWGQSKLISWRTTLGSQNRDEIQIWTKIVQNLWFDTRRTSGVG
jgi:hypothetical protein